jgi:hypothetical protein
MVMAQLVVRKIAYPRPIEMPITLHALPDWKNDHVTREHIKNAFHMVLQWNFIVL